MYDFGFSSGPQLLENNLPKLQINDARYHEVDSFFSFGCLDSSSWTHELTVGVGPLAQVSVIYHQSKKVILLVDKSHVKSMENPKTTLPFSDIYIGGAPSSILKSRWVKYSSNQTYYAQHDRGLISRNCMIFMWRPKHSTLNWASPFWNPKWHLRATYFIYESLSPTSANDIALLISFPLRSIGTSCKCSTDIDISLQKIIIANNFHIQTQSSISIQFELCL